MRKKLNIIVLLAFCLLASMSVAAQERGQYVPGTRGLNTADQPPPGFTYINSFSWYPTSTYKDRNGVKSPITFHIDQYVDNNVLAYTPKKKFLGAIYSASLTVPIQNSPVSLPDLGVKFGGIGVGDLYVEPLSLGWELKKWKIRAAYGFVAPTGRYHDGATDNTTTDYWGHEFTFGGTYYPSETGHWQINASSVWELHQSKRHERVRVGDNVTFEYGVGKTLVRHEGAQQFQFGIVGYSQFQLTNEGGLDAPPINMRVKDRVHAIGPEFGVMLPARKFSFFIRVLPEYGARARTQGVTVVTGVGKTF
jgi:hypothetical protein